MIYEPIEILKERIIAEKDGKPLIYKCKFCQKDINLNYVLSPNTFRGNNSYHEFLISGLCQECQDSVFGKEDNCKMRIGSD
jgi:hypothetical protein